MSEPYVLFRVAGTTYGLKAIQIQQVEMLESLTPVPDAPEWVDGIVYLRSQVVPVVNLRRRFGLERLPADLSQRLIVVQHGARVVGLAVDSAREFTSLDETQIVPAGDTGSTYVEAVATGKVELILILSLEKLLDLDLAIEGDPHASK